MLFKGTQRRTARQIAETMDGVGGNLNAFTDKETTCYYAKVIDRHVPLALDVLADMFLHSTFDPHELSKEQKVILEEIKMYEDSPDELIHDVFLQTMWSGSSLGEPTIGFADTVVRITPDDLRAHMRAHYAPNSVVVAAAGNVEHERFVELVAEQFASFEGACALPEPEGPATTPAAHVRFKDSEQAHVVVGNARHRRARRASIRALVARHGPRRRHVEPPLSGDSRAARARVQRLFVSGRLSQAPASSACMPARRPRTSSRAST